jgi:hypothetical protein
MSGLGIFAGLKQSRHARLVSSQSWNLSCNLVDPAP